MRILEQRFRQLGLKRVAAQLVALSQECLSLKAKRVDESALASAVSKLGGFPDLPPSIEWPRWRESDLSFVAQINTRELPRFQGRSDLPNESLLSFFYDADQSTWGRDPKDRGSWRVIVSPLAAEFGRRPFPATLADSGKFHSCSLSATIEPSVPYPASLVVEKLELSTTEADAYFEFYERFVPPEQTGLHHQLFGHPHQIQGDMQLVCESVSNRLYFGDPSGYSDEEAEILASGASEWRLLLQVDSDDGACMMWGDVGHLYFWIQSEALRSRDFGKVWMILQCY